MVRDAAALIGLAMLGAGCAFAWLPLGLIVPGACLLLLALAGYLFDRKKREPDDS